MDLKQEELTVLSVRSALDHLKSTINRAVQRIERQKQLQHAELFAEIKERKKLAKALELEERLIELFESLRANPKLNVAPTSVIHCEISDAVVMLEGDNCKINFRLNDIPYQLFSSNRGGSICYGGETFASQHLSLNCEGETVMSLQLDMTGEVGHEKITGKQIVSFVPGKWIYDVIHAYETLRASRNLENIYEQYSDENLAMLGRRFGIESLETTPTPAASPTRKVLTEQNS